MDEVESTAMDLSYALEQLFLAGPAVSTESFVHPLGFVVFPLVQDTLIRLRLHVWDDSRRYTQEPHWPIHNHRFSIRSHILFGELTNELFRVVDDSEGDHALFGVHYENGCSVMRNTRQRVRVALEHTAQYGTNDAYTISREQFHATHVRAQSFAATLVFVYDELSAAPLVVGNPSHTTLQYQRTHLDPRDAHALLCRVQTSLNEQ